MKQGLKEREKRGWRPVSNNSSRHYYYYYHRSILLPHHHGFLGCTAISLSVSWRWGFRWRWISGGKEGKAKRRNLTHTPARAQPLPPPPPPATPLLLPGRSNRRSLDRSLQMLLVLRGIQLRCQESRDLGSCWLPWTSVVAFSGGTMVNGRGGVWWWVEMEDGRSMLCRWECVCEARFN